MPEGRCPTCGAAAHSVAGARRTVQQLRLWVNRRGRALTLRRAASFLAASLIAAGQLTFFD